MLAAFYHMLRIVHDACRASAEANGRDFSTLEAEVPVVTVVCNILYKIM